MLNIYTAFGRQIELFQMLPKKVSRKKGRLTAGRAGGGSHRGCVQVATLHTGLLAGGALVKSYWTLVARATSSKVPNTTNWENYKREEGAKELLKWQRISIGYNFVEQLKTSRSTWQKISTRELLPPNGNVCSVVLNLRIYMYEI